MALRINFRALLTQCGEPIENGELVIENGTILEVSPQISSKKIEATLNLSNHLLMPGFINTHSHLGLTALANKLTPSKNFADWIFNLIYDNSALSDEERMR